MTTGDAAERLLAEVPGFHRRVVADLGRRGIDVEGMALSHLGVKTATSQAYERLREALLAVSSAIAENVHNGRPIAKIVLAEPVDLGGVPLELVEVMPPKARPPARLGAEHLGFVVGPDLEAFARRHAASITERQDQGPLCQPACVALPGARRAKFYDRSLRAVVEAEGTLFQRIPVMPT